MSLKKENNWCKVGVYLLALLFMIMHFVRIFDFVFWGDEGLAVLASRMDWSSLLVFVVQQGHSPLHYVVLWIVCQVFEPTGAIYHFVSLLPVLVIMLVTATYIRKRFGNIVAVILLCTTALLDLSIRYCVEVRMYTWCQLFVFLFYIIAERIFTERTNKNYILLTLMGIGAAHSHYFALGTIGLLYFMMLVFAFFEKDKNVKKAHIIKLVISGVTVLLSMLPWVSFCTRIGGKVISNYGITADWIPGILNNIFSSDNTIVLFGVYVLLFIYVVGYKMNVFQKQSDGKDVVVLDWKQWKLDDEASWIISGAIAVFGTILVADIISRVLFPISLVRYFYPSFIILWLQLAVCIARLPQKNLVAIIVALIIVVPGAIEYRDTLVIEKDQKDRLEVTLEITRSMIGNEDHIITDQDHFNWTGVKVYYPGIENSWLNLEAFAGMEENKDYFLFLDKPIYEDIITHLEVQNKTAEQIVQCGHVGTGYIWVYKVVDLD